MQMPGVCACINCCMSIFIGTFLSFSPLERRCFWKVLSFSVDCRMKLNQWEKSWMLNNLWCCQMIVWAAVSKQTVDLNVSVSSCLFGKTKFNISCLKPGDFAQRVTSHPLKISSLLTSSGLTSHIASGFWHDFTVKCWWWNKLHFGPNHSPHDGCLHRQAIEQAQQLHPH